MRLFVCISLAACSLVLEYGKNLIYAVDLYDIYLDRLNVKEQPALLLTDKTGMILLAILFLTVMIAFFGLAFERYALSVFLSIFIYTLMDVFKEAVNNYLPLLISKLPEGMKQHVSWNGASGLLYATVGVIVIGVLVFVLLYNLIKMISMVLLTYLVYDWAVKTHFALPETLDIATKIAIFIGLVVFYMLLKKIYSFIFAFAFASYGGLYVVSFGCCMFSNNEGSFSKFLRAFFLPSPLTELKKHRETLFWAIQTVVGFLVQMPLAFH